MSPFPEVFGHMKEWLVLELHEMKRVVHIVARLIDFKLLCARGQQGGMLKLMKNDHFLVFLTVRVFFPKFLGR